MQALSFGQSLFRTHSGLQPLYGSPKYCDKQVQTPSLQLAFVPQGDGLHLSIMIGSSEKCAIQYEFTVTFTNNLLSIGFKAQ